MSATKCCLWLKVVLLLLLSGINIFLYIKSCGISYQYVLAREHTKFRQEMPTMDSWINSPFGRLNSYLFNVTNAEDFLSGKDKRMKVQQVGPITYNLVGYIDVLHRNESSITFKKNRYRHVQFMPDLSVSPDILNQTITLPNSVLLGAASKFSEWKSYVRYVFNAITLTEKLFLTNTVYYFLWEFSTPGLTALSNVVPFISSNCGTLYNALSEKEEIYTVKIGPEHGMENFFRIEALNGQQIFKQQEILQRSLLHTDEQDSCPINAQNSFDNSLFPPFVQKDSQFDIVTIESCRTLRMRYQREQMYSGMRTYRYSLLEQETPSCMNSTYGTSLPQGMFDVSKCVINDAPSAFSGPQFFGSSYNWSEHFEGLNPNAEDHEPYILLEPITGIPLSEKVRFQSNIPMPDMSSFNRRLAKFSNVMLPTFWFEFDMGDLPWIVTFLIKFNVFVTPVLQPILMGLFVLLAIWCMLKAILLICGLSFSVVYRKICGGGSSNVMLETTFPVSARREVTQLDVVCK